MFPPEVTLVPRRQVRSDGTPETVYVPKPARRLTETARRRRDREAFERLADHVLYGV